MLHNSSSISLYDNPSEYQKNGDSGTYYKYFETFNIEREGEKTIDRCKHKACVRSQQSSLQFDYKCKNHEYYMDRIKSRYLVKLMKDERLGKNVFTGCDSVDECKSLKSLELQKYKKYIFNQYNILRQEYKKEAEHARKEHTIEQFAKERFPTGFHITDHSYQNDFLMKITLDYIEKMVNDGAKTDRKSVV